MIELAWPAVALIGIAAASWLAHRHLLLKRDNAAISELRVTVARLHQAHSDLLLAHKDELLPKLEAVEDRLGRAEMELGVTQ